MAVTAGYIHEQPRREFFAKMDAANVDLKAFTDDFYFKLTGSHLQPVLDTLVYLKHGTRVWFEITTLLIPGSVTWLVPSPSRSSHTRLPRLNAGTKPKSTVRFE